MFLNINEIYRNVLQHWLSIDPTLFSYIVLKFIENKLMKDQMIAHFLPVFHALAFALIAVCMYYRFLSCIYTVFNITSIGILDAT